MQTADADIRWHMSRDLGALHAAWKEWTCRSDARTLALEQLLEALRHDACRHHAPHAARRLVSGSRLSLCCPRCVGLLHIKTKRLELVVAVTQ